jgi:hypothetical protein
LAAHAGFASPVRQGIGVVAYRRIGADNFSG